MYFNTYCIKSHYFEGNIIQKSLILNTLCLNSKKYSFAFIIDLNGLFKKLLCLSLLLWGGMEHYG